MQALGRMKSIETMERITRQKFCDNFDEILDRVDNEDIGFVILNNEGKDGHVLCPARWFQINFSDDLGCIINSALRYCRDAADERVNTNWKQRRHWYQNGGRVTHEQLKHIRLDARAEIFRFIRQLPVNMEVTVNGIKYKLVHASPVENYMSSYWYSRDYKDQREFAVWERWGKTKPIPEGYMMIFGHTPTCYFQNKEPLCIWKGDNAIGIDCGAGFEDGRLSCLRLDDMREFYSES